MKRLNVLLVLFTILSMGICFASCSEDDPTMEVSYDSNCNESVKITIFNTGGIRYELSYNIAGIAISKDKSALENIDALGYQLLDNYYRNGAVRDPEIIGNVMFFWAPEGEWLYATDVESHDYMFVEHNVTYYYRLLSFGQGREGGKLVNLWLHYGDIAKFTTPK